MERKHSFRSFLIVFFMLLLLGGIGVILFWKDDSKNIGLGEEELSQSDLGTIVYEGQKYHYKENLP